MTRGDKYILNEAGEPVVEPDLMTWAHWFEGSREVRRVALTEVGALRISTVFLGLDYSFTLEGPPIVWETMVFDDNTKERDAVACERCGGSREQAEAMHERVVERYQKNLALSLPRDSL